MTGRAGRYSGKYFGPGSVNLMSLRQDLRDFVRRQREKPHPFGARLHGDKYGVYTRRFGIDKDVEIIGNRIENPELLK